MSRPYVTVTPARASRPPASQRATMAVPVSEATSMAMAFAMNCSGRMSRMKARRTGRSMAHAVPVKTAARKMCQSCTRSSARATTNPLVTLRFIPWAKSNSPFLETRSAWEPAINPRMPRGRSRKAPTKETLSGESVSSSTSQLRMKRSAQKATCHRCPAIHSTRQSRTCSERVVRERAYQGTRASRVEEEGLASAMIQ